jgi:hypothetical protein
MLVLKQLFTILKRAVPLYKVKFLIEYLNKFENNGYFMLSKRTELTASHFY